MKYWLKSAASSLDYPLYKRELEDLAKLGFTLTPRNAQWQTVAADSPEVTHVRIDSPAKPVSIRSLAKLVDQLDEALILSKLCSDVDGSVVEGQYEIRIYNDYVE